jgi:hypothetical protein
MQGSLRAAAAIFACLACLGPGCATHVDVSIEQQRDLAGYRTWNFLSQRARSVDAPVSDVRGLEHAVTRFVERCMRSRGFERATERPDFHVLYFLEVRRERLILEETPAASSLHSLQGPVYDIQVEPRSRVETYETGRLRIFVTDAADDAVIWQGDFAGRFRGELSPHLGGAVSDLLELLPEATTSGALPVAGAGAEGADLARDCASGS